MNEPAGDSKTPLTLTSLALVTSLAALGGVVYLALFRLEPEGSRLDKYDFSTPDAALKSELRMEIQGDFQAAMELHRLTAGESLQQKIDTLEVHEAEDWNDLKILFISYQQDKRPGFAEPDESADKKHYETMAFEKHEDTGFWKKTYAFSHRVARDNPDLAKRMQKWENRSRGIPDFSDFAKTQSIPD